MTDTTPTPGGTHRLAGHDTARIGYGAMQLAESRSRGPVPSAEAVPLLRHAAELGATHIDTAEFYGDGAANRLIREALHPYDGIVLVSKVGAVAAPGRTPSLVPAQKPAELRAQVEQNLRTLGADRLAVVNLRRVDGPPGIVATGDQIVSLDDQLAELIALRDEGKIDGIGLSSVTAAQIDQAIPAGIVCVQNLYNLVAREGEDALDLCRRHGIAWVPFFPLGSGFPGAATVTDRPAVQEAAANLGATAAQVGLAWLLAHADNTMLIPGTTSIAHLEENIAAGDLVLDAETMGALEAV
jgi:pyridoxine 4-dehydrogenase